jgi:hypothetical protein
VPDAVREAKPPFSPEATIEEHAQFFLSFGLSRATSDRWGGQFPAEQFRKHGIECDIAEKPKSDIYKEVLSPINSNRVELLDLPRLTALLCGLERRTARGGRDSIDHAPGGHDDSANAAAGALLNAQAPREYQCSWASVGGQRFDPLDALRHLY